MKLSNHILVLIFILGFASCKEKIAEQKTNKTTQNSSTDLQVDHLNIWVENPNMAKEKLIKIGFTAIPDSLSQIHHGQGTAGRYFNFLNGYLELIFVHNQNELEENNLKNKDLDFTERANYKKNEASPFSIALKIKDYDIDKIPFKTVQYHQDWMEDSVSIYSAKNSKTHLNEPSIFVVYPEIESQIFESLPILQSISSEDEFWKSFFKHPNGAKKITNISITSTSLDLKTETIKAVNEIKNITVKNGNKHLMELYFDNNIQGKSFDLRPELPLIIYL
ncbi:VOC family protein [uncultured Aquimarina sp.]|uniref:VOC family protein n=1 Tax=uncultured Aquimarina sp. TaxID=575652 RepID=UPI00261BF6A5|nr:VOC family protein [uncultured Aquimarina sp.]